MNFFDYLFWIVCFIGIVGAICKAFYVLWEYGKYE